MASSIPIEGIIALNTDNWNNYITNNKPVLVVFWSKGWADNDAYFETIIDLYGLPKSPDDLDIVLCSLDMMDGKNSDIAQYYDISVSPTSIVFTKRQKTGTKTGVLSKNELIAFLKACDINPPS